MRACPRCRSSILGELEFCPLDGTPLYEAEQDPLVGHDVGRYHVEALLGRGAMGSVYRAVPMSLDRAFALKVLHADVAADKKLVERFFREADALSKIRHSNIVSVVDFVATEEGLCALVMEYLPGIDLAELMDAEGPLPADRLSNIARGVALGLDAAHRERLIHRDIKPSNVRIVNEGGAEIPKLVDFGVVRHADQGPEQQQLTGHNHLVGTPRYMAPEMVLGEAITPAVDLYALGVMMHEMATGEPPFSGQTTADVLVKQATEPTPPLPGLDGLERLIEALMAKDPADRPATAAEVVAWLDAPPPPPPALPPPPAIDPPAGKRRGWVWAVAGIAVAALAVGAWAAQRAPTPAPIATPLAVGTSTAVPPPPPPPPRARKPRRSKRAASASASGSEVQALEKRLSKVLTQRGLTRADLASLSGTKKSYRSWRRARARKQNGRAARALETLVRAAQKVRLEPKILERRLDRLLKAIRGSRREVPEVLSEEIERRYFELRVQAREAKTETRFRQVSRRITLLERKHRKYVYGD